MSGTEAVRMKKTFRVSDAQDSNKAIDVVIDFEAVEPGPTNHARQVWPLVVEWRELPPGVHREMAAGKLANACLSLAAALDRANLLLADPKTPRRQGVVESCGQRYCLALAAYQQEPEGGARQQALDFLLKFGLAACEAIDGFNARNAPFAPLEG